MDKQASSVGPYAKNHSPDLPFRIKSLMKLISSFFTRKLIP